MIKICKQCNKEFNTSHKKQIFCSRICTDKSRTGIKQSIETCIKKSNSHLGKKRKPFTKEHKNKISKTKTGKKLPPFTKEHKEKIGKKNKGKVRSSYTKKILSEYFTGRPNLNGRGINSGQYKGGITPLNFKIRNSLEMKFWKKACMGRDNFTCQKTGIRGGKLVVHHINNFADFPELRTSISNGITLSKESHIEFHKIYGFRNNTKEQLLEFLNIK